MYQYCDVGKRLHNKLTVGLASSKSPDVSLGVFRKSSTNWSGAHILTRAVQKHARLHSSRFGMGHTHEDAACIGFQKESYTRLQASQ